jgi:lipoprotein signal peptidase
VLILDQWSKYLVRTHLPASQIYKPDLGPFSFIEFVYLQNSGALMSSFKGMNVLFISLAVIICGILLFAAPRVAGENGAMRLALGLLLGRAI